MPRPCLDCGALSPESRCPACHRAKRAKYGYAWQQESKARRTAQPWCSVEGCRSTDLSVDHHTRAVLCRRHHALLEARRRGYRG